MIESFDNAHNNSSQDSEKNQEEAELQPEKTTGVKETPEFSEDRIDRVRLKAAIEIAQEGNTAPKQFEEKRNSRFENMNENELRTEIRRAEENDNESEVLRLEKLILNRENESKTEDSVEGENEDTSANSEDKHEKTTETNEKGEAEEQESVKQGAQSEKEERVASYEERLSSLAKEKDPLLLARVALQETFDEIGTTEAPYLKAGPFERLIAADKLEVVRELEAFKEKTRNNTRVSERDHVIHLKGLIYDKIAEETTDFGKSSRNQHAGEVTTEVPKENKTEENLEEVKTSESVEEPSEENPPIDSEEMPSAEVQEEQPQDKKEEEASASNSQIESFEAEDRMPTDLSELKESALLKNVVRTLRESIYEHLKASEGYEDPAKIERAMNFFDQQIKNIFNEEKEGAKARRFVSESLKAFLPDSNLSQKEEEPYKKVLELLSKDEKVNSFDRAA